MAPRWGQQGLPTTEECRQSSKGQLSYSQPDPFYIWQPLRKIKRMVHCESARSSLLYWWKQVWKSLSHIYHCIVIINAGLLKPNKSLLWTDEPFSSSLCSRHNPAINNGLSSQLLPKLTTTLAMLEWTNSMKAQQFSPISPNILGMKPLELLLTTTKPRPYQIIRQGVAACTIFTAKIKIANINLSI